MEERYYMDGRHRDGWQKHNSYVGKLELESYSKRWWDTKNLVFTTNKHVPNIPCNRPWKTFKNSLRITAECEKQCIAVTYDLAIAKMEYQIKSEEKPKFDSIFEAFHLEIALFHNYGRLIAESGGPHMLNECLVLAKWSTKSFQASKNYKRLHEILDLAMEKLHFESFLKTY